MFGLGMVVCAAAAGAALALSTGAGGHGQVVVVWLLPVVEHALAMLSLLNHHIPGLTAPLHDTLVHWHLRGRCCWLLTHAMRVSASVGLYPGRFERPERLLVGHVSLQVVVLLMWWRLPLVLLLGTLHRQAAWNPIAVLMLLLMLMLPFFNVAFLVVIILLSLLLLLLLLLRLIRLTSSLSAVLAVGAMAVSTAIMIDPA